MLILNSTYFKAAENVKDSLHIPAIICKREGFHDVKLGVAGLGYQWQKNCQMSVDESSWVWPDRP